MNYQKFKRNLCTACATASLFLIPAPQLWAGSSYAQSTRLSLELSNATISDVFASVEKNSEYRFFYSDAIRLELHRNVDVNIKHRTIDQILSEVLKDTNLSYILNDRQVMIVRKEENTQQADKISINGTVRDAQQEPLPGVNVLVKGTTIGTTTDIDGNYFINVPNKNAILVFSYIGFEPQEVKVGGQININVNMSEESNSLEEVVVVGYGSQKRASVVGSITAIEPGQLQQGTTRAVSNNLAGQLAGVIAVQRSGEPGADGSDFWIRGISSFKGTGVSPLVLVDGIERTLDDLSAAEIESFSVLKDAAASAVYGVRGANGVIIVKTKRGQLGKPKVDFHMEQGFTQPTRLPKYIGSADYLALMDELYMDAGNPNPLYGEDKINNYRNGVDPELYPNINWLDAVSKDVASNTRGDLTITGGSDILRYALVASYYGERGIFVRDKSKDWDSSTRLNKYNIRSNVDINVTKTTIVGINIGG